MKRSFLRWPEFRRKAVTLSYDDGVKYDVDLIKIMDKYGLKGTFNLCSGFLDGEKGGAMLTKEEAKEVYGNSCHEVAVHGVQHYSLAEVEKSMAVEDVINDKKNLEQIFGRIIKGMAYANGSYNDSVVEILKNCSIAYARTVNETESFEVPTDWLRMSTTCHHNNPKLMELAKKFVEAKDVEWSYWHNAPMLFYLWGHSYEFNNDNNWNVIEEFAKYIGGREDIWYATNGEIYDYVQAYDRLQFSVDGKLVHNPSAIDVYIAYFRKGTNYIIPAGKTIKLEKVK